MESSTVAWSALRTTKNTARSWFCRTLGKPTLLFPSYIPSCSNHAALAATKSERFTFASEGKAEKLHVHTLPRTSAGSLGEIFSWRFPLAHAENCLSFHADRIVWGGKMDVMRFHLSVPMHASFISLPVLQKALTAQRGSLRWPLLKPSRKLLEHKGLDRQTVAN